MLSWTLLRLVIGHYKWFRWSKWNILVNVAIFRHADVATRAPSEPEKLV